MTEHELWSFNTSLFVITFLVIILFIVIFGIGRIINIKHIKDNWATERCSPMIMPFAGLFGYNTKENFEFCMGKIFNTHSQPYMGSVGNMFSQTTGLLSEIFDSISSLRNTMASLGGGINVIFQEFTERISMFFFKLRVSAIHIKTLMGRMYAILFSVMYMGLSGITGMTSFTNTFLFAFLDIVCFPGNTIINVKNKGPTPIKDIQINDILLPTNTKVTGTFRFYCKGQPMVKLGNIIVSTNHYIMYKNKAIKSGDHPDAIPIGIWDSEDPLYCLDTSDNLIPIDNYLFLDYDETSDGDKDTMMFIENKINSNSIINKTYTFKEYCPAIHPDTKIKTTTGIKLAKDIKFGDKLVTGGEVVGLICRQVNEICKLNDETKLTPSTLYWNNILNKWERIGDTNNVIQEVCEFISFLVIPNSQIELESGLRIRDYMELCSPDSEMYYSKLLEK